MSTPQHKALIANLKWSRGLVPAVLALDYHDHTVKPSGYSICDPVAVRGQDVLQVSRDQSAHSVHWSQAGLVHQHQPSFQFTPAPPEISEACQSLRRTFPVASLYRCTPSSRNLIRFDLPQGTSQPPGAAHGDEIETPASEPEELAAQPRSRRPLRRRIMWMCL
jgi:hypothetical protein